LSEDSAGRLVQKPLITLWKRLRDPERLRFASLVGLMAIGALMESLGIGAMLPVIAVMQSPDKILTQPQLAQLSAWLGSPPTQVFFIYMLSAVLLFFTIKNLFLVLVDILQFRYLSALHARIATELMDAYLHRSYTFHLGANTAHLVRNVTSEVDRIFYYTLAPLLQLTSETLVIVALFVLVVVIDPVAALVLCVGGGCLLLAFFRVFRERMAEIGRQLQENSGMMMQYAQEGLGGIKEIKVMGREKFFRRSFDLHALQYARALRRVMVVNGFPVRLLETVFVAVFVALLVGLTLTGRASQALPLVGVYAAAAFRLMPSLSRVMTANNRIRQSSPSLALVMSELSSRVEPEAISNSAPLHLTSEIRVESISFRYPGAEFPALRDVSLTIRQGEMVGFVGRSGSGKSTLIDCLLGILTPDSGEVYVDGDSIRGRLSQWRRQIGYIPQEIFLTDDSIRSNVALGIPEAEIDDTRVWNALAAAHLGDFVSGLPEKLEARVGERGVRISGGQRQRIGIARALYGNPEVLLLDEATSALDPETERAIVHTIAGLKGQKTVLVIAHRLSTIQDCDRVYALERGALVDKSHFVDEAPSGSL
jgi:ATP-binding cassette subfamily C protein